jgi:hypothetical protein
MEEIKNIEGVVSTLDEDVHDYLFSELKLLIGSVNNFYLK